MISGSEQQPQPISEKAHYKTTALRSAFAKYKRSLNIVPGTHAKLLLKKGTFIK